MFLMTVAFIPPSQRAAHKIAYMTISILVCDFCFLFFYSLLLLC